MELNIFTKPSQLINYWHKIRFSHEAYSLAEDDPYATKVFVSISQGVLCGPLLSILKF